MVARREQRLVEAWADIHLEELLQDWKLLQSGQPPLKIEEYELLSDGREMESTQQGITTVSRLQWEGDALVVTWRTHRPDGEMNISFRHELLDAGRRLRAVERLRGNGRGQDNVWMFDRP